MGGLILKITDFMMLEINGFKQLSLMKCIAIILFISSGFFITAISEPDNKDAWIWSMDTRDLNDMHQDFYLPNEIIIVNWTINSSGQSAVINDSILNTYISKANSQGENELYATYSVPPKKAGVTYANETDIIVSPDTKDIERTDLAAITAYATTKSGTLINETHIIEIKVKQPGTLNIHKIVSGGQQDLSSGWRFTIKETGQSDITDEDGIVSFSNLRPGNYTITEELKSGWKNASGKNEPSIVRVNPGIEKPTEVYYENTPNKLTVNKIDSKGQPQKDWYFDLIGPDGHPAVPQKRTDENGIAVFQGFASGTYRLEEVPQDGWRLISISSDSSNVRSNGDIDFGSGESIGVVVTNAKTGALKIIKKDSEGRPLSGWTFSITGPEGQKKTDPTDADGTVVVGDLLPGDYAIKEDSINGWVNISPISQSVVLQPGEIKQIEPFINAPLIMLRIIKFSDENRNGKQDTDENGLSGWWFTVIKPDGKKIRVGPTDDDGVVTVDDLIPGTYQIAEELNTVQSYDGRDCTGGWICTTNNPQSIKIAGSELSPIVKFGNKVNTLTIKKFNDTNLNKKQDDGEVGLSGWTFRIEGPDGRAFESDPTDADGVTVIKCLIPGRYSISEIPQAGWINTTPLSSSIDVKAGEDAKVSPFGNIKSSRIEIFKFNDTNRNKKYDSYESGLQGWIYTVKCPDGSIIVTEPTNTDGITSLQSLTWGTYIVTEELKEGWLATTSITRIVNLSIGESKKLSFGNYYCDRCHRITDEEKTPINDDGDIRVIKEVSNLTTENIDRDNGNVINYNITVCPSRSIGEIAEIPTDIVIAVDNSPSISNLRSVTIDGVEDLSKDIEANDKKHVTRIGLVSWSDEENSGIEVPLIDNYTEVSARASNIKFAEGNYTKYQVGLDTALQAFKDAGIIEGKEKKIVFVTDASDSGYIEPNLVDLDLSGYSIFAIVVGDHRDTNASRMLNRVTREHNGYVIPLKDLSELGEALVKTATAGSLIKNVHLVEVLPNYLVLLNSSATDDSGKIRLNGDSKDWTTTTITWDIGDLADCWSTDFQAVFCWKLPADVNQPRMASYINYTDESGMSRTIILPEHEINIVTAEQRAPALAFIPTKEPEKEAPGFGVLLAIMGVSVTGYLYRRRVN